MPTRNRARVVLVVLALSGLLAACSDSTVRSRWTGSEGGETVEAVSGSRHCDWSSITFIDLPRGKYAADPEGLVPADWREAEYAQDVDLPGGAVDSGLTSGDERIWYAADETVAFVGTTESVDAWPRIVPGFGCD
ncbi:hypothetical protein [Antribacter gilvus]|uniref:hypothetical protein n=1 Tax=Antribacter gilvus TaxID=2304675 RepID=UPI000F7685C6|nr:hypothetical protein [Antribacter gilvus]